MYETDKIDMKIIELLMEDGRMPAAEIARRIGDVSSRTVRYRIEQLIENNLIKISAIVNPRKFGYSTIADVFIEVETGLIQEVAQKLAFYDRVSYIAYAIGETDVSIQVVARDTSEVYSFVTDVIGKIPGVRKTTTSIVPLIIKDVYQWRVPEPDSDITEAEE